MARNPYEPPAHHDGRKSRSLWKQVCLASLWTSGLFLVASKVLEISARNSTDDAWFKILAGFLALGELVSWTMIGLGGIGWIITRRRSVTHRDGSRSGLGA